MAHAAQRNFCQRMLQEHNLSWVKSVLDIGSRDINGNNRWMFPDAQYLGIDKEPGPNVDIVVEGDEFWPGRTFDAVLCTEVLEHTWMWRDVLSNAADLLSPQGILLVTCAGPGRPEHGTASCEPESNPGSGNYYKNLSLSDILVDLGAMCRWWKAIAEYDGEACDTRFFGITK